MLDKKSAKKFLFLLVLAFLNAINTAFNNTNDDANTNAVVRGIITTYLAFVFCVACVCTCGMITAQGGESCVRDARDRRNELKKEIELCIKENQSDNEKPEKEEVIIEIGFSDETTSDESEDESRSEINKEVDGIFSSVYERCKP